MGQLSNIRKQLGSTNLNLSPIGLGTVKFGRNEQVKYPNSFEIPDETTLSDFLDLAESLGINTLDTAPAYGASEERLGRLLKDQRESWIIVGKAGEWFEDGASRFDFSADAIEQSLHESLERLNTDYIDALLLHSNGDDTAILSDDALITRLHDMKSQGLIKAHGMSTKTVEGGKMAVGLLDCVMATARPGYDSELPVLDHAKEKGKGALLKKALASGHIDRIGGREPVQASLEFAFDQPAVACVIIGTINPDHLRYNVEAALRALNPDKDKFQTV